jgi:hypothetical protein
VFNRIDFELGRSRVDLAVKVAVFGVGACAFVYAQLELHWFLICLLSLTLCAPMGKRTRYRFLWDLNRGDFKLYCDDMCLQVVSLSSIRLMPGWVAFKVRTQDGSVHAFIICQDAVPKEEYRKLRVALKYAPLSFEPVTIHS